VGGVVGLWADSPIGSADAHPRLEGGGGDTSPSSASLIQSRLEGGRSDTTQCRDDTDAIRFTLVSFYFLHTYSTFSLNCSCSYAECL
jgi:hypothetical protein